MSSNNRIPYSGWWPKQKNLPTIRRNNLFIWDFYFIQCHFTSSPCFCEPITFVKRGLSLLTFPPLPSRIPSPQAVSSPVCKYAVLFWSVCLMPPLPHIASSFFFLLLGFTRNVPSPGKSYLLRLSSSILRNSWSPMSLCLVRDFFPLGRREGAVFVSVSVVRVQGPRPTVDIDKISRLMDLISG